jgi:hypothetical protein
MTVISIKEQNVSKTLKIGIIFLVILCIFLLVITFVDPSFIEGLFGLPELASQPSQVSDEPINPADPDLNAAVALALENAGDRWEIYDYQIDHIQVQDDGLLAIVWLAAIDLETGELVGREPELALGTKTAEGGWKILLEDDDKFMETFKGFQYAEKSVEGDFLTDQETQPKGEQVFGGYYLPWAAGLEKRLTWSVAHSSCTPVYYCTHAFDFADGTMFPLVAAKGGTVYHWKDTCANGDSSCTNSITLEDRSTTPWTYQIYLHIAQNSVPDHLRQVGTPVMQGQYIADVDDTGYSTGHHVHFMVVTEKTRYTSVNGYVWGVAEDITYRDVDINWDAATQGGRPRLAYEAEDYGGVGRTYYVSGNVPANPPTGELTAPLANTYLTSPNLSVGGWGDDDIAVTKMEVLANVGGSWVKVGTDQTLNPFTTTIDLCNTDIPDGFFELGLRVWDYEGNPSGILSSRMLLKDVECGASGTDPKVDLVLTGGKLVLPQNGFVSATATKGSTGSAISSVEFWLHSPDAAIDEWVNLGKDTNGTNGWQAPISTSALPEGNNYTVMAIVTDAQGNGDVTINTQAIVDRTLPQLAFDQVDSPVFSNSVTLNWTASDSLSGLDRFDLAVSINGGDYQTVTTNLSASTRSYQYDGLVTNNLYLFALKGYDKAGNAFTTTVAFNTEAYVFPYQYIIPMIFGGN